MPKTITLNTMVQILTALFLATATLLAILGAVVPAHGSASTNGAAVRLSAYARVRTPDRNGPRIGSIAPDFALLDTHGQQHSLSDMRGRVAVLNFWAFWCDTWKAELPDLKQLAPRQEELGFRLAALSVDGTRYEEFRSITGDSLPFPVLMDVGGKISQGYQVGHVPTVVIVDPQGRVRYTHSGYPGNDVVLSEVRRIESEAGE